MISIKHVIVYSLKYNHAFISVAYYHWMDYVSRLFSGLRQRCNIMRKKHVWFLVPRVKLPDFLSKRIVCSQCF